MEKFYRVIVSLGISIGLVVIPHTSRAEAPQNNRPKIGLVLKGGGALGFAHVGVLKVLEQNRIPVDYIAGTSMGSIVGAAYASGSSLSDMEWILAETNWDELFGEKVMRENVEYRMKSGRGRELFGDGKIGFDDGTFVVPQGVVAGQNIRLLFQKMFGNPPSPIEFDSLPIPFRAITSDVETGEAYVPDRGDLATAVRASMSVPGAFSPVEMDGKLLVDGGIADNLPVDVALKMGADILIVVDLKSKLASRNDLKSPFSVSGQIISILLMQNSINSRKLVRVEDIVIEPDVSAYNATQFDKGPELMVIGEESAKAMLPALKRLSVSPQEYEKYKASRLKRIPSPTRVDFVRINNDSNLPDSHIKEILSVDDDGNFDPEEIDKEMAQIYQSGYFDSVGYSLVEENGKTGMDVDAKGKQWLHQYVKLGFGLEDNLDGDDNFRLAVAYRTDGVTTKDSYLELQGEIGATPKAVAELYQPFYEGSDYFISPKLSIGESTIYVTQDNQVTSQYSRTEGYAATFIGRRISTLGETSVGYTRGFGDLSRKIGDPDLPSKSYDIGDVTWRLDLDSLDKPDFPTSGFRLAPRFNAAVEDLGASGSNYQELAGTGMLPLTWGQNTIIFGNRFVATFGDRPIERYYTLGGFLNVSGTLQNSLPADNYNTGSVLMYHRFSELQNPFFNLAFFAGGSYEATTIQVYQDTLDNYSLINSGSVFIGADTPLLPIYIGFGMADIGDQSFYIMIGRLGQPER